MNRRKGNTNIFVRLIRYFLVIALILMVITIVGIVFLLINQFRSKESVVLTTEQQTELLEEATETQEDEIELFDGLPLDENGMLTVGDAKFLPGYIADATEQTKLIGEDVISQHGILINESTNEIIAQKDAQTIVSPASMTKILTVLVAAEHLESMDALDDDVTITLEMTDFAYRNGCSIAGFKNDEVVKVRDLFYGTILPSGGDAAMGLAIYTAGSHEAFVEMMNEKLEEIGLSETAHFTNCVGLYDENHYCTVYDMAMILKAAVQNDWCRDVLSMHKYTTTATEQNPEGNIISNWFLRRIEDKETGGLVLCAKTGFVNQSGSCAASYQISNSGTPYICVTTNSTSSWQCIYDHVAIYEQFAP